jgi:predicted DsbA family dithiol-disulfide isomerase
VDAVHLIAYSDYLCPWCYNAAVRLERLEAEFAGALRVEWRSFLLRPAPRPGRDLERFRAYTQSWLRPAAEADSGAFRVWEGDAGPPSHSVPAHVAAKAAASLGEDAFRRMHRQLLQAYFGESRDVSDADTLRAVWHEAGLPDAEFARTGDQALHARVLAEHHEALASGVTGVPAVRRAGDDAVIVGAQPTELYRRWVRRTLARAGAAGRA